MLFRLQEQQNIMRVYRMHGYVGILNLFIVAQTELLCNDSAAARLCQSSTGAEGRHSYVISSVHRLLIMYYFG